ncbi:MAG: aspartyl protease family protein, partial [Pseudomonadota bacterium]
GQVSFTGPSVNLSLVDGQVHPLVLVDVSDREEHRFVVDTGAAINVIDNDIAKRLGYEVIGTTEIGAPGGPRIAADIVHVPELEIGELRITDAKFVTMNLNEFSHGIMQGVLGLPLFQEYLLTFDKPNGEIRLSHASLSEQDEHVVSYSDVDSHIQVTLDVAGRPVPTHIDTGSMASFTLPIELMETLPTTKTMKESGNAALVGGNRKISGATLDGTIRFAGLAYQNPRLGFMDPSPGYGNLGNRILGELIVSVDQRKKLISFQKPQQDPVANTNSTRQLGLGIRGVPGGTTLAVTSVAPESIAERAGFKVDDTLTSINGKLMSDYDMAELGTLMKSTTPLVVGVERNGQTLTIEVP